MQDGPHEPAPAAHGGSLGAAQGAVPPPPPPPPPRAAARRLTRSRDDRLIAGVAGGLGRYFGLDPLIFRIGFVALSIAGGVGLLLYAAAWLLVPESETAEPLGLNAVRRLGNRRAPAVIGIVLIVVALLLVADNLRIGAAGLVWGLALVAVGILLLNREAWPAVWGEWGAAPPSPASGSPTPGFEPGPAAAGASAPAWVPASPAPGAGPPAIWTRAHSRGRPPRSVLGWITIALAILAVGVAALLNNLGVVSVSLGAGLALIVVIIGLGLIAGAWFGRSRGLIVIALALLPFAAAATLVHQPITGGAGDRYEAPQALTAVHGDYGLAAGKLTLDLSQVDFTTTSSVRATVALGQLVVVVPRQTTVDIHGTIGAGELDLLGRVDDGLQIDSNVNAPGTGTSGVLHLDLGVGLGQVRVIRSDTSAGVTP